MISFRGRALAGIITTVLIFVALVILGNMMADEAIHWFASFPFRYLWWGLGILAAIALLVWLVRKQRRRPTQAAGAGGYGGGRGIPAGRWLGRALATIAVLTLVGLAVWYVCLRPAPPPTPTTFTVKFGSEWTESIAVPLGSRINWERANPSDAYQFETQTGVIHTRSAGPVTYTDHGKISSVRFKALGDEPVVIRVRITR